MTQTTTTQVQQPQVTAIQLVAPELIQPVALAAVPGAVTLDPEVKAKVDAQLDDFVKKLMSQAVNSDAFRGSLDSAFSLGRKEIADATTLTNMFTKKNFVGETDTPAYKAIAEMRQLFDDLNPANQGDLFTAPTVLGIPIPTKFLGVAVPFGDKLKSYLRRYESAEVQFAKMHVNIADAKDEVQKGVSELGTMRQKMWDGLAKLESVVYFVTCLDERVSAEVESLKLTQPDRARALEQEVLYYVRQNVGDVRGAQALTINGYNVAGELRKTGREVINGCDRLATLGMAAMSLGVTLAKASGVQVRTMAMVTGASKSVESLLLATGKGLQDHIKVTTDFSSNPVMGVEMLKTMFAQTDEAMATLEAFRSNALDVQKANNEMLGELVEKQSARLKNDRRAASAADGIAL